MAALEEGKKAYINLRIILAQRELYNRTGRNILLPNYRDIEKKAPVIIAEDGMLESEKKSILARSERYQKAMAQIEKAERAVEAVVDLEIICQFEKYLEITGINLLPDGYEVKKEQAVEAILLDKTPVSDREAIIAKSERFKTEIAKLGGFKVEIPPLSIREQALMDQ